MMTGRLLVGRFESTYIVTNDIHHTTSQRNTFLIYLDFENPTDIEAWVSNAVAAAGTAGLQLSMSIRELYHYGFLVGLGHRSKTFG
jgi:hypothetical protein